MRTRAQPVYVAGIGCARGCPAEAIAELAAAALASRALRPACLTALASLALKADEAGLLVYAETLGVPVAFYPAVTLNAYVERLSVRSARVYAVSGCWGVAEAAALAHAEVLAGCRAELLVSRWTGVGVSFALAGFGCS